MFKQPLRCLTLQSLETSAPEFIGSQVIVFKGKNAPQNISNHSGTRWAVSAESKQHNKNVSETSRIEGDRCWLGKKKGQGTPEGEKRRDSLAGRVSMQSQAELCSD